MFKKDKDIKIIFTLSQVTCNRHNKEGLDVNSPFNPRLLQIAPYEVLGASRTIPQNVSLNEYEALK